MKKSQLFKQHILSTIAGFLLLLAPVIVEATGCAFFWGEPECPECLKQ